MRWTFLRHDGVVEMLGMIGRPHSAAQGQAEESEERGLLDCDRGNTILTSSAKRKAESPRAVGRSLIYNRNFGDATKPGRLLRNVPPLSPLGLSHMSKHKNKANITPYLDTIAKSSVSIICSINSLDG